MIYVLGMSHVRPVLDACSIDGIGEQLSKIASDREPAFVDWETIPGLFPDQVKAASIYIAQVAPHWGTVLAQMTGPDVVGVTPGFQGLLDSIDSATPGNILFAFMHGEEYHHMSVREYNAPYDFEIPSRPDLGFAPGRQVIPLEIVKREALLYLQKSIANFYAIRTFHPGLRIVNVICPPPSNAGDIGSPATHYVRLKNYLVYVDALREATEPAGIETLLPPAEALTQEGLLRAEYDDDFVHGNKAYGALVVQQMRNLLTGGTT